MIIIGIWTLGLAQYMDDQAKNFRSYEVVMVLVLIEIAVSVFIAYEKAFESGPAKYEYIKYANIARLSITCIIGIILTYKIRKVFYERTIWWIFIEVVVFAIGVFTLTSEIQNFEKHNRDKN